MSPIKALGLTSYTILALFIVSSVAITDPVGSGVLGLFLAAGLFALAWIFGIDE